MILIAIIAVVLILAMVMFMLYPISNIYKSDREGKVIFNDDEVGFTIVDNATETIEGVDRKIYALRYGNNEPFLVYTSIPNLGRWELYCLDEHSDKHFSAGYNLSMELQVYLNTSEVSLISPISIDDMKVKYKSSLDGCLSKYNKIVNNSELIGKKFNRELAQVYCGYPFNFEEQKEKMKLMNSILPKPSSLDLHIPVVDMRYAIDVYSKIMENNFTSLNDHSTLYNKKVYFGSIIFNINYKKVSLVDKYTKDEYILYYIDYILTSSGTLSKFTDKRYNAPISIEFAKGFINDYGMRRSWVNPFGYICNIVEYHNRVLLTPQYKKYRSIDSTYLFMGDIYDNIFPLQKPDGTTIEDIAKFEVKLDNTRR